MRKFKNTLKLIILACFVLMSTMLAFTACDSPDIQTPENVRVNDELELAWFKVDQAKSYEVSITCVKLTFTYPLSDAEMEAITVKEGVEEIRTTRNISYSIEYLPEGDYEFKVRAVPSGRNKKPSEWSSTVEFHKDYSTGCTYQLINSGTEYAVYRSSNAKGDVRIEDEYKGKPVTQISRDCFKNNHSVTKVHLGKNIKSIGDAAFSNCKNLKTVIIPEGVTYLGQQAFQASNIEEISIPSTVKNILPYTFYNCKKLKTVDLGENIITIGEEAFKNCYVLESIKLSPTLKTIDKAAFHMSGLKSVNIPASVSSIATEAFYSNSELAKVTIEEGSNLKTIPSYVFYKCLKLKGIILPEGIERIEKQAFALCAEFEIVNIPSTVTYIGSNVFTNTKLMVSNNDDIFYIDDWVITVSSDAKNEDTSNPEDRLLTGIASEGSLRAGEQSLKAGVKGIAASAFAGAKGLRRVVLPDTIEYINPSAFANCTNLTNLVIGEGSKLKEIPSYAFYKCSISNFNIRNSSIESIADFAFAQNANLNNNTNYNIIPKTVTHIGSGAFNGTKLFTDAQAKGEELIYAGNWLVGINPDLDLASVSLKDGTVGICDYAFSLEATLTEVSNMLDVSYIGQGAFYQCTGLVAADLGDSIKKIEPYTFYECSSLYRVKFPEDLQSVGRSAFYRCFAIDDLDLSKTSVTSIEDYSFYSCSNLKTLKLNPQLVAIKNFAFYGCSGLKEAFIPNTVQTLGDRAFANCSGLEKVVIEMPLTKLPERMFYKCTSLKEVVMPDTITEIGAYAFYQCERLQKLRLGENVTHIGDYAFYNNVMLHDIELPKNLTHIGRYAFKGAINLRSIYLSDKIADVGQHAFYGAKNLTVYVEAGAKSEYWNVRWNSSYRPVIYNCKLSEDDSYLVSVEVYDIDNSMGLGSSAVANALSNPKRAGYKFVGWSTTSGGAPEAGLDVIVDVFKGTVLYACWEEGEEQIQLIYPEGTEKPSDKPSGGLDVITPNGPATV